jgi:hypothetical protein
MVKCALRPLARVAVLAVVAGSVLAGGGLAADAWGGEPSSGQPCASVTLSDQQCSQGTPVPSLQPKATRSLWQHLVVARGERPLRLAAAAG